MDILRLACSVSLSGIVEVVGIAAVAAVDIVESLKILLLCFWNWLPLELVRLVDSVKTKVEFRPPAKPDLRFQQNARHLAGAEPLVIPYRRPDLR